MLCELSEHFASMDAFFTQHSAKTIANFRYSFAKSDSVSVCRDKSSSIADLGNACTSESRYMSPASYHLSHDVLAIRIPTARII